MVLVLVVVVAAVVCAVCSCCCCLLLFALQITSHTKIALVLVLVVVVVAVVCAVCSCCCCCCCCLLLFAPVVVVDDVAAVISLLLRLASCLANLVVDGEFASSVGQPNIFDGVSALTCSSSRPGIAIAFSAIIATPAPSRQPHYTGVQLES